MANKEFKIANISCPITDLDELVKSWRVMYPTMSEDEIKGMRETAERLTIKDMNFVFEKDANKDYSKKLLLSAKKEQQVMLVWPKGTGKTTSIYYIAQETSNPLVPIQLNGSTWVDTLIWKWLVNEKWTYWQDGSLTMARKYWFRIILDELNMALPEITAILHPALDDRHILVLDEKNWEVIKKHPNTRIFAAINPTEDYAGTKEMNAALVDRFAWQIIVDYPEPQKEIDIILSHKKVDIDNTPLAHSREWVITRMVKVANSLRKLNRDQKLLFECSTRNLIDWACWCSELTIKEACELALISKADREDLKQIRDAVSTHFRDDEVWKKTEPKKRKTTKSINADGEIILSDWTILDTKDGTVSYDIWNWNSVSWVSVIWTDWVYNSWVVSSALR